MIELRSVQMQSGVNDQGRAFVTVVATGDENTLMLGQIEPAVARTMAMQFLEVAEAADQDAIVFRLLRDKFNLDQPVIAAFVQDMRDERES